MLTNSINECSSTTATTAENLAELSSKSFDDATSIASATEQQLASVEEQTSATITLAEMAEELSNKISKFIVD